MSARSGLPAVSMARHWVLSAKWAFMATSMRPASWRYGVRAKTKAPLAPCGPRVVQGVPGARRPWCKAPLVQGVPGAGRTGLLCPLLFPGGQPGDRSGARNASLGERRRPDAFLHRRCAVPVCSRVSIERRTLATKSAVTTSGTRRSPKQPPTATNCNLPYMIAAVRKKSAPCGTWAFCAFLVPG